MKHVDVEAAVTSATRVPVKAMTRIEKLRHWSGLVRSYKGVLQLYDGLEYWQGPQLLNKIIANGQRTAFALAVGDPAFQAQGLENPASLQGIMQFFEVTQPQLHSFSCNCGGEISNEDQAARIDRLAGSIGGGAGLFGRAASLFTRS